MLKLHLSVAVILIGLALDTLASSTVFRGKVVRADGRPIADARLEAQEMISLRNTPFWRWGPGSYLRGTCSTARDGSFVLQSTSSHIDYIIARSPTHSGNVARPDWRQFIVIRATKLQKPLFTGFP